MKSRSSILAIITALLAAMAISASLAAQDNPTHTAPKQHSQELHHYAVITLGTLGGGFSSGNGLNSGGSVAGASLLPGDTTEHAFLWRQGVMTDLGTLGGPNSDAVEAPNINNRDEVVGYSDTVFPDPNDENFCAFITGFGNTANTCVPFIWSGGVMTSLPLLGGNNGIAMAVNNPGELGGVAENNIPDPNCLPPLVLHFEPVIWEGGTIRQLPTVAGDPDGYVNGINDNGEVVGFTGPCFPVHAVFWGKGGEAIDLGNLGGAINNIAFAINNREQVVGQSDLLGDDTHHAFLWQNGVMTDLGTLPGLPVSLAGGINNVTQVVGFSQNLNGSPTVAWIWQDGVMTDLNTLIPAESQLFLVEALGINDRGEISGYAINTETGAATAFLATPCDEHHPGLEGCDYSMVEASAATAASAAAQATRTANPFHQGSPAFGGLANPTVGRFGPRLGSW